MSDQEAHQEKMHAGAKRATQLEDLDIVKYTGSIKPDNTQLTVISFNDSEIIETRPDSSDELPILNDTYKTWINIHGLNQADVIKGIANKYALHQLVLEDILNVDQRSKADNYGNYLFIVVKNFFYNHTNNASKTEQISLILCKNLVITFQERPTGLFESIRELLRNNRGNIRSKSVDFLAYALIDVIIDRYFNIVDEISSNVDHIEETILNKTNSNKVLNRIYKQKRTLMNLRKIIWPIREMVNGLLRDDQNFFTHETILHLKDVYDHTVHLNESIESLRDVLAGMLDIYLSNLSNKLNIEIRTLTIVTMLFMPATLITGIFGMNFDTMPLLKNPDGFWDAITVMGGVAVFMILIFWRLQWLSNK